MTAEDKCISMKTAEAHDKQLAAMLGKAPVKKEGSFYCTECGMVAESEGGIVHDRDCQEKPVIARANTSGLRPLGCAVLIEPYEPEISRTTLALPPQVRERTTMVEMRAVVIEVGPECWTEESQPRAGPGDKVFITKFAGHMAIGPKDGKQYRLVNDRDIFCRLEE